MILFAKKIVVCTKVRDNRALVAKNVNSEGTHPAGEGACRSYAK